MKRFLGAVISGIIEHYVEQERGTPSSEPDQIVICDINYDKMEKAILNALEKHDKAKLKETQDGIGPIISGAFSGLLTTIYVSILLVIYFIQAILINKAWEAGAFVPFLVLLLSSVLSFAAAVFLLISGMFNKVPKIKRGKIIIPIATIIMTLMLFSPSASVWWLLNSSYIEIISVVKYFYPVVLLGASIAMPVLWLFKLALSQEKDYSIVIACFSFVMSMLIAGISRIVNLL